MTTTEKEARYIQVNVASNNNKFWNIRINPDNSVTTTWGRVGDSGQSKDFHHTSFAAAEKTFNSKCREKERKGYVIQRVIADGYAKSAPVAGDNLSKIALSQIQTNSPELDELIKFLTRTNIHNILSATTMQYDSSSGLFSTPLGIVTADAIQEARTILVTMANLVHVRDFNNSQWDTLLSKYLTAIPQNIGRRRVTPELFFPDQNSILAQNKLLDDLDASLQSFLTSDNSGNKDNSVPQVFDVQLHIVNDGKIIDRIKRKYDETRQRIHASYHLDIARVFAVDINAMSQSYINHGQSKGNVMELWHGTRVGNLLSILKGGLRVPPASSPHVTGRMFGDGLYFSDQSTKSLNYAYGAAPGQKGGVESSTFMFLADVAMGNYYVPRSWAERFPKVGYDSTYAKAGQSGVMNNEMIVYSTNQCNLTYLVEFKAK